MTGHPHEHPATTSPVVKKQQGVTHSERYLTRLCERSFLSLWSYPGVYRDQGAINGGHGKEVCDLLVVFGDDVILFSDKDCAFPNTGNLDLDWSRWFRRAVQRSAEQVWGAERWIRAYPNRLFLDRACSQPFPVPLPPMERAQFHRIVVAHDAARRCRELLAGSGSIMIFPPLKGKSHYEGPIDLGPHADMSQMKFTDAFSGNVQRDYSRLPFMIGDLDPTKGFVHVFDDTALSVAMGALDTISDFVTYLTKKEMFLRSGRLLVAAGEDDLVASYLQTMNDDGEYDFFVPPNEPDTKVCLPEGEWSALQASVEWNARLKANEISYGWDRLIEQFNKHIIDGTSTAYPENVLEVQERAVRAMAREPRFVRRMLTTLLSEFLNNAVDATISTRVVGPPRPGSPYYLFLTVNPDDICDRERHRDVRRGVMHSYCLALKLRFPEANDVVVIATEPDNWDGPSSQDVMYCDISTFTPEDEAKAKAIQADFGFLAKIENLVHRTFNDYPPTLTTATASLTSNSPSRPKHRSMRNSPCPCGSGKKYKACCLRRFSNRDPAPWL